MTEDLRILVELQTTDSAILERTDIIETIPRKVSSVEQPLRDARSAYEKAKQRLDTLAKKKKDREQQLDEIQERIKKLKARMSEIKTNKEYQAHLKEIESVEREQRAVEDDILSAMEALDSAQKEADSLLKSVKAEEERIETFKAKLQEEAGGVRKEIDELRHRRETLIKAIDTELYSLYLKLMETKRGLAVVEARDEVCQGCNMNIPPQLFVEIKKNEKIIQCPQCTRILYWRTQEV